MFDLVGFAIGNGESRSGFDLGSLRYSGVLIFGCNALYRDFAPDVLFARDYNMIEEIKANYNGEFATYKKPVMRFRDKAVVIPQYVVLVGSVAIWCMCRAYPVKEVYLIGFDPFPIGTDEKNNVYKGTPNYAGPEESAAPRVNQCITDLSYIFKTFPLVRFVRVGDKDQVKGVYLGWDLMSYQEFKLEHA